MVASPCRNCFLAEEKSICSSRMSSLMSSGSKVTTVGWPDTCGCTESRLGRRKRESENRRTSGAHPEREVKPADQQVHNPRTSAYLRLRGPSALVLEMISDVSPVHMNKHESASAVSSPGISSETPAARRPAAPPAEPRMDQGAFYFTSHKTTVK